MAYNITRPRVREDLEKIASLGAGDPAPIALRDNGPAFIPAAVIFDKGQVPTLSCVNKTDDFKEGEFERLISALQKYLDLYFTPVWGASCRLEIYDKVQPGHWGFVFVENVDVANAFGYHDLTDDNLPISKMFTEVAKKYNEPISITASHELCEMLCDAAINLLAMGPDGMIYALEVCDAVEADSFPVDGFEMSNFQYPSWFESFRAPGSTQFDYLNLCKRPFEIRKGGYMSRFKNGKWSQIFANDATGEDFKLEEHLRATRRTFQAPMNAEVAAEEHYVEKEAVAPGIEGEVRPVEAEKATPDPGVSF